MSWVGGADCGEVASGWGSGGDCAVVLLFALPHFFLWVGVISSQLCGRGGDVCPIGDILFEGGRRQVGMWSECLV